MRLINAVDDIARDRIQSEITLTKLLEQGVDFYFAQQIAAQELANATERRANAEYEIAKAKMEAYWNEKAVKEEVKEGDRYWNSTQ